LPQGADFQSLRENSLVQEGQLIASGVACFTMMGNYPAKTNTTTLLG